MTHSPTDRAALRAALWADLVAHVDQSGLREVAHMLDAWSGARERRPEHPLQEYNELYLPGLPDEPWLAPEAFPFHERVVAALPLLEAAARRLVDGSLRVPAVNSRDEVPVPDEGGFARPEGWLEWMFYRLNRRSAERAAAFPEVAALADEIAALSGWVVSLGFQIMKPGVTLGRHTDVSNFFVTYQMGALVTAPGSFLEVAGERRQWEHGACRAFNNSYLHDAYNHSPSPRVLFTAYVLHPRLTAAQKAALTRLANAVDLSARPELVNGTGKGLR